LLVARKEKVNPLRFWHLVECVNRKNGNGSGNGHGNGHGSGNGNGTVSH